MNQTILKVIVSVLWLVIQVLRVAPFDSPYFFTPKSDFSQFFPLISNALFELKVALEKYRSRKVQFRQTESGAVLTPLVYPRDGRVVKASDSDRKVPGSIPQSVQIVKIVARHKHAQFIPARKLPPSLAGSKSARDKHDRRVLD